MKLVETFQQEPITDLDLSHYCVAEVDSTVMEVMSQMRTAGCTCTLVTAENRVVGIFTNRDVMRKVIGQPDIREQPIGSVMSLSPRTIRDNATAAEALSLMDTLHLRNLPVVSEKGELVGNFTHYSILRLLADAFPEGHLESPT